MSTEGQLLFYRNMSCVGAEPIVENFTVQRTPDGIFYTYYVELEMKYRNIGGGYSSGIYVVMDENLVEFEEVCMLPNQDPNHTHGQGYLDQHELVMVGGGHYLTLSYTPLFVDNLPEGVAGIDGGRTAYVWAGIFQEVKDGKLIAELNTTDYPMLYDTGIEFVNYAATTDQGVVMPSRNGPPRYNWAGGVMDYVHPNSIDYTLKPDGTVDKMLISMRTQCAVYQFDMSTGAIDWILGGRANTFSGLDEFSTLRVDQRGREFKAFTYAQHDAHYVNKNPDQTITGNPILSIFDNQTGTPPYRLFPSDPSMAPTRTRTLKVELDEKNQTAQAFDVIEGADLSRLIPAYRVASHCGNVKYISDTSIAIGWGLHVVIDYLTPEAPYGTASDEGYEDLRGGSRPALTEYDKLHDKITFEFYIKRNPMYHTLDALYCYRAYRYNA